MSYGSSIKTVRDSRRNRAFTLIEVLVGFTLTVLLVGLLFQFLIPALKISAQTTRRAEVQQQATLAMRKMIDEIEHSTLYGISFSADPTVIAIHPIVEVTQNSKRVYADHVIVYKFDKDLSSIRRNLWRTTDDPSIDSPRKLSPQELLDVEQHFVGPERVMVERVEEFDMSHSGPPELIRLPLALHLKMKEQDQVGGRSFELIRSVSMRNQQ